MDRLIFGLLMLALIVVAVGFYYGWRATYGGIINVLAAIVGDVAGALFAKLR